MATIRKAVAAHAILFSLLGAALPGGLAGAAVGAAGEEPPWQAALSGYLRDPARGRRALLALARHGTEGLPAEVLIVLADAQLRRDRRRVATALFQSALAAGPEQPWAGWAHIGLAWAALHGSDTITARAQLALAAEGVDPVAAALPRFMVAWLDAADRVPGAAAAIEALAGESTTPLPLANVARMAGGYARLWAGEPFAAAAAFDAVVADDARGRLADDARYAAARARWLSGDRDAARDVFRALEDGWRGTTASRRLAELEPRALVRAAMQRWRRLPPGAPGDQLVEMIDLDAAALARTALLELDAGRTPEIPVGRAPSTRIVTADGGGAGRAGAGVPAAARAPAAAAPPRDRWPLSALIVALGALAAAAAALQARTRRRRARRGCPPAMHRPRRPRELDRATTASGTPRSRESGP